jgi:hypothetical protein
MRAALGILWLIAIATAGVAQSGGGYDLSWGVIAGGGVTFSTGGNFALGSTIGQPVAIGAPPCAQGVTSTSPTASGSCGMPPSRAGSPCATLWAM